MTVSLQRGSGLLVLVVLIGAVAAALYFTKAPDGTSYLDKALGAAQYQKEHALDPAKDARSAEQQYQDNLQRMVDEN